MGTFSHKTNKLLISRSGHIRFIVDVGDDVSISFAFVYGGIRTRMKTVEECRVLEKIPPWYDKCLCLH